MSVVERDIFAGIESKIPGIGGSVIQGATAIAGPVASEAGVAAILGTSSPSPSSSPHDNGLRYGATIGVAVGCSVAGIIIIGVVAYILRCRYIKQQSQSLGGGYSDKARPPWTQASVAGDRPFVGGSFMPSANPPNRYDRPGTGVSNRGLDLEGELDTRTKD